MAPKKSAANRALGEAIRALRKKLGCTQEEFAAKAGIDRSYYGSIERGEYNLTVDTLGTVAAGLGVSLAELFERAGL